VKSLNFLEHSGSAQIGPEEVEVKKVVHCFSSWSLSAYRKLPVKDLQQ